MLDWKSLLHLIYLRYSLTGRWNFKVTTEFVEKKLLHLLISLNETHSKSRRSECSIKQLFWNFSQSLQERIFKVCNFTKTKTSMQRRIQGKEEGGAESTRAPLPPPFFCNHLFFFCFCFCCFFWNHFEELWTVLYLPRYYRNMLNLNIQSFVIWQAIIIFF